MANLVDRGISHGCFVAVLLFAWLMLAPLSLLALLGPPVSFLLGFSGLAGLLGASTRIFLGPRFFLLSRGRQRLLVGCLAVGAAATFLAFAILPARIYWATPIWFVSLAGILVLLGSITGPESGSHLSSTRTRGARRRVQASGHKT
ncbi:hypothetical protein ACVCL3_10750 [Rhodanobacter sp. UC4437_H4]|jgi:hypothetical protein